MRAVLVCLLCWATGLGAAEDGGQPLAAAKLPVATRPAALGGAYGAVGGDTYGLALNPALVATLEEASLGTQYASLASGRSQQFLGFGRPLELRSRFAYEISYHRIALDAPLEHRRSNTPDPDYTFSEGTDLFSVGGAAWLWRQKLAVGLSLRSLSAHLGEASGAGYSGDLGLLARPQRGLDLGLSFQEVSSKLAWNTEYVEKLPLVIRGAAAYHFWQERVMLCSDLEKSEAQAAKLHLGLECWALPGTLALRGGWAQGQWSFGLGLRTAGLGFWDFFGIGREAGLDYALVADPVGDGAFQQRLSLDISFDLEGS